jgi:hypothetical protein
MPTRIGVFGVALAFMAGAAVAQHTPPSLAFDLHLRCTGAGLANDPVLVAVAGDRGRIRLPHALRHSIGDEGWRPMWDISVDEHLITGRFEMNLWNRPLVVIERVTGRINFTAFRGFGFHGDCIPYDANTAQKF